MLHIYILQGIPFMSQGPYMHLRLITIHYFSCPLTNFVTERSKEAGRHGDVGCAKVTIAPSRCCDFAAFTLQAHFTATPQLLMTTEVNCCHLYCLTCGPAVPLINITCAACERLIVLYYQPLIRYMLSSLIKQLIKMSHCQFATR